MNPPMSPDEFRDYLRLLTSLLRLSRHQQAAIAEELRSHLEARFDDLIQQGIDPQQAVSTALAEFGDAAALAAELSAISRLKNRRRIMRLTTGSLIATLLIAMAAVALWPDRAGNWRSKTVQAQQTEPVESKTEPTAELKPADPNEIVWRQLEQEIDVEVIDVPLEDAVASLSKQNHFQFYFDRASLENEGIDVREALVNLSLKNIPLRMALRLILDPHDLSYTLDHGVVIITTQEAVHRKYLHVRVYGVGDLVERRPAPSDDGASESAPPKSRAKATDQSRSGAAGASTMYVQYDGNMGFRGGLGGGLGGTMGVPAGPRGVIADGAPYDISDLADVILLTIDPESWEEYGVGFARICQFRDTLIISQTVQNHRKIEKLLNDLRQAVQTAGPPIPDSAAIGGLGGGFGGGRFDGGAEGAFGR